MKYKVMECCKDMYRTGVYAEGKRIYAKVEADTEHLALLLYQRNEQEAFLSLAFDPGQRVGNVWFWRRSFPPSCRRIRNIGFLQRKGVVLRILTAKAFPAEIPGARNRRRRCGQSCIVLPMIGRVIVACGRIYIRR